MDKEMIVTCQKHMEVLNTMVGLDFESAIEVAETIELNLELTDFKMVLSNVITNMKEGPIYHYLGNADSKITIEVYVMDSGKNHKVVGISSGPIKTYIDENMKKNVKGPVN